MLSNCVCPCSCRLQEKLPDDKIDSGRIPRTIDCEATQDLVDKVIPGDVVGITGIVKVTQAEKCTYSASMLTFTTFDVVIQV